MEVNIGDEFLLDSFVSGLATITMLMATITMLREAFQKRGR
jgi:hypothetical protein